MIRKSATLIILIIVYAVFFSGDHLNIDCIKGSNFALKTLGYQLDQDGEPYLLPEDTQKILDYAKKYKYITEEITELNRIELLNKWVGLYKGIKATSDTSTSNKYLSKLREPNPPFTPMDFLKYKVLRSDAIIKGTVIKISTPPNTDQCLYYKSTVYIRIDSIIKSDFKLKINDVLLAKEMNGAVGKCFQQNKGEGDHKTTNLYEINSHSKEWKLYEDGVYFVSHNDYYAQLLKIKNWRSTGSYFEDKYCGSSFVINDDPKFNLEQINYALREIKFKR